MNRMARMGMVFVGALVTATAMAQLTANDPDWKDAAAVQAPAFNVDRMIEIDGIPGSRVRFGIDPDTIVLTPDGVLRYVMIAKTDSAQTVSYEGIQCKNLQWRLYARHNEGRWMPRDGDWQLLADAPRHARVAARAGVCEGRATPLSAADVVRALKAKPISY